MSLDPRAQTVGVFKQQTTAIVPISEIRRIQQRCFGTDQNFALIDKMELHAKSLERVKKWPNTLQALRKKKDQTKFERFKADEEERRKIEQEEAQYQAGVKQAILEKANLQIYENNDRIRAFQSKLLLTDVVQEREAQLELKNYLEEGKKVREQIHYDSMLEDIAIAEQQEYLKKEQQRLKKLEQQKILKQQHDQMVNTHIKAIQNDRIEGQLVKAKALQLIQDEEDAAKERRKKRLENMEEVKKGNQLIKEEKKLVQQKELEDDEKIRKYAEKKEQIMEMRKQREELKFKEKQAQRQRLIDFQIAQLESKQEENEKILNKQILEAQIKAEEVERIKREKKEELVQKINWSRKLTSENKEKANIEKFNNDIEFKEYWQLRNQELKSQEEKEDQQIRGRNVQLKKYHIQQIEEKQKIREQQILQDLEEQEEILRKNENQNRVFTSYAERAIKEWSDNGKTLQPLIKELNTFKQN